ncbi:hypothetical protein BJ508DRAFT_336459 [Ascobolus immersus RN42]|uniref:Uncharacterized protein n=1 Tax=Ascobolus immersus RN42 TaxID=1160509 RepID=A0A3N4H8E3_ASCIM|nr:hypothetical protein BJ508DRAFT_336459 [Ascobolus immersus RN42]
METLLQGSGSKKQTLKSIIYWPENGEEYWDEKDKENRWRCKRCKGPKPKMYSQTSSRSALDHLEEEHHINRKIGTEIAPAMRKSSSAPLPPGQQLLQFRNPGTQAL